MISIPDSMQAIIASQPGDAHVLTFAERAVPQPKAGEVLLRVLSAGVNRPDIMQREGLAQPPIGTTDILGLEACGEVAAIGAGVAETMQGQRLMALLPGGGYAPWCVARLDHCLPVPEYLDDDSAGALPEGLFTVWHNLFELGNLKMGQTVLIHGASGGIGTLALRMAHAAGAMVIATAGRPDRLSSLLEMGASRAICYRDTDFVQTCLDFTHGRGVDVVLDVVGGDYVRRNLQSLAFGGRHVSLSFLQGSAITIDLLTLMQKQISLHSSTMRPQSDSEKTRMTQNIKRHVLPLVADSRIRPRIHASLALADVAHAHELLEQGEAFGKIVLKPSH